MIRYFVLSVGIVMTPAASAEVTLYLHPSDAPGVQEQVQAYFLAATTQLTLINLDDLPAGPVVGTEWSALGVNFSQPQGGALELRVQDAAEVPHSPPNSLWPVTLSQESIDIALVVPRHAVAFWLIDSEDLAPQDLIEVFDERGMVIHSFLPPVCSKPPGTECGAQANFFIGLVSTEPIARIRIGEFPEDGEFLGIDDIQIADACCDGDLSCDGVVNGFDLAQLLGEWTGSGSYTPCPPSKSSDMNQDCKVNGFDLASLLAAWGPCP